MWVRYDIVIFLGFFLHSLNKEACLYVSIAFLEVKYVSNHLATFLNRFKTNGMMLTMNKKLTSALICLCTIVYSHFLTVTSKWINATYIQVTYMKFQWKGDEVYMECSATINRMITVKIGEALATPHNPQVSGVPPTCLMIRKITVIPKELSLVLIIRKFKKTTIGNLGLTMKTIALNLSARMFFKNIFLCIFSNLRQYSCYYLSDNSHILLFYRIQI